ncbi:MAG: cobalt-precorrin-6A reductase [Tabrizicola sp.]|uniref:cobalt-precorrin-6A reductase n=1 Tax=Tabrizicola sp. TaxID=2005166 RepID=UPI00273335FF|nr:cobalt-precorrin-6A reductase [Tabrizicola sp.]MDP3262639.1 cobalt-precorrin-6A reductase [Tabrizicola sp.]MDP3647799.1 cobalt-precorrin-6A reductase [Paracoccaceae bacterium]
MTRILLLGGTTEAGLLARAIAEAGLPGIYSYAGRTDAPLDQPIPMRVGGFGGVEGLCAYLKAEEITHVIDATHPFAAQMSGNAVAACAATKTPLLALERAPWVAGEGDHWHHVADIPAAVAALAGPPRRVFLAIGRQHLDPFAAQPQHHYLLRLVDAPTGPLPLPQAEVIVARGPFDVAGDTALLRQHQTGLIVAKNAGGKGAVAKIAAARALGLPVLMIDRPRLPKRQVVTSVKAAMDWLHHTARLGV